MALHLTSAEIQTLIAKTTSNLKPYEVFALVDALERVPYVAGADGDAGSKEVIIGTIFPNLGLNP
jgi:hypothetical protein